MITHTTEAALQILSDLAYDKVLPGSSSYTVSQGTLFDLLIRFELYGLIKRRADCPRESPLSYTLERPISGITLLEVLEATDEHLNCNHEADEQMYDRYGMAARKLGVINLITRKYLSEIRLMDVL